MDFVGALLVECLKLLLCQEEPHPYPKDSPNFLAKVELAFLGGVAMIVLLILVIINDLWRLQRRLIRRLNESDEEYQRKKESLMKRIEETLRDPIHECPICLSEAELPVMTDCGHIFCCACIIQCWKQNRPDVWPCYCTYCRSTLFMLHRVRWSSPATFDNQLQENNKELDDYNKRFSNRRSTRWDFIEDIVNPSRLRKFFHIFCDLVEAAPIDLIGYPLMGIIYCCIIRGILFL